MSLLFVVEEVDPIPVGKEGEPQTVCYDLTVQGDGTEEAIDSK